MSVIGSNILAGASGQGGGYNLTKSLRFRKSANGYLSRTMNATSTTYTVSAWVKRGLLSGYQYIFASGSNTASNDKGIAFDTSTNQIYAFNGSTQALSSAVFRDPSAWYHVVMSVNSGTATVYVNNINTGISQTSMSLGTYGRIGRFNDSSSANDFDGYMAEFNLIDGQALTPSSFGETSTTTGVWIPKKYTGTYGTNGFYLPFTDTTSTSTLGTDFSGNSNTWTVNNISLTSGSTYDSMTDVPTLTSATTANFNILNPAIRIYAVTPAEIISNGNLTLTCSSNAVSGSAWGTTTLTSEKWYFEATLTTAGPSNNCVGFSNNTIAAGLGTFNGDAKAWGWYYQSDGNKAINNTITSYGATYTTGDVIGIALDITNSTITFYKNNVSQGQLTGLSLASGSAGWLSAVEGFNGTVWNTNFGQRPFAYTPPTGFVALNTFNLPTPTIGATASTTANKYFNAITYAGNGLAISSGGMVISSLNFQPDFVWIKDRTSPYSHNLSDVIRGPSTRVYSNLTNAEDTNTESVNTFNSNGFTVGNNVGVNTNGNGYAAWNWKANGSGVTNTAGSITSTVSANTTAGFSVVTYTGTGANATVGHGLGVAPSMIIIKNRSTVTDWAVYHSSNTASPATQRLLLNTTDSTATSSVYWNNTAPTSSVFSISTYTGVNNSSHNLVAYCFAPVAGYSAMGSYTGNGSTDGTFVYTGFRPRFFMVKRTDSANDWVVLDTSRNTYNVMTSSLFPNSSSSETSNGFYDTDFLSNGFKIKATNAVVNASGGTYIYMAFAEVPYKFSNAR